MPAGPVGEVWAEGSWEDTAWEENVWGESAEDAPTLDLRCATVESLNPIRRTKALIEP